MAPDEELAEEEKEDEEFVNYVDFPGDETLQSGEDPVEEEEEEEAVLNERESFRSTSGINYEAKLRQLMRNLCSVEVEIYSEASEEFVRLVKGHSGGDLLQQFVQTSPRCVELLEAWRMRVSKPGMVHVFALAAAVLNHPAGKLGGSAVARSLDSFARVIVSQKLDDVYKELNCEEFRRQNAALRLLAAVVRRGMGLATEVARSFDFKLPVLAALSGMRKGKGGKDGKGRQGRCLTRKALVEFAISFLEVGNPRLLRWILQQRDMYFSVLRGIATDEEDTVILVLSVLRDKVLSVESMLPRGLRSVLFGSVTLEQLIGISGSPVGGDAADLAHQVLVMVCSDPCNGLMPGSGLKGNPARLVELMRKLKATEIGNHKELLLAIVKGRPSLCSLFMDVFPYNLEPSTSPQWFSAVSLVADLISSTNSEVALNLLVKSEMLGPPDLESHEMQCILKCIIPCFFTRSVSNKGLLHSDMLVKHASLRLVLEMFKSLHNLFGTIGHILEKAKLNQSEDVAERASVSLCLPGLTSFIAIDRKLLSDKCIATSPPELAMEKWVLFKEQIEDEVRSVLPDPQVLLKLLSSSSLKGSGNSVPHLKRCQQLQEYPRKRPKPNTNPSNDDIDNVIGGLHPDNNTGDSEDIAQDETFMKMDVEDYLITKIEGIWELQKPDWIINGKKDADVLFHTKLLDVLAFYVRTMPTTLEGTFDFFKILPSDPSSLALCQKQALLSLLVEYAGLPLGSKDTMKAPEMMYKHLQPLVNIMILSEEAIRRQAYTLSRLAMKSTGAFDQNFSEIDAWFLFLPGYRDKYFLKLQQELHGKLAAVIISFLCDAVSTVGNNLYRYLDQMRVLLSNLKDIKDYSPSFGPLVICILQKCLRLLDSDSGSFKMSEKALISLYVSNSISFLLQTQVNMSMLAGLVDLFLTEKFGSSCSIEDQTKSSFCEWRPLKNLLVFCRKILHQQACDNLLCLSRRLIDKKKSSMSAIVDVVREIIENEHDARVAEVAISFSSSVVCASPDDILENLPLLIMVAQHLFGAHPHCLSSILFLEWDFLSSFYQQWPDIFCSGLEVVEGMINNHEYYDPTSKFSSWKQFVATVTNKSISDCIDSKENASIAFSLLLKHLPFYSVFGPILNFNSCGEAITVDMLNFLHIKISERLEDSLVSLRLVLFWAYQIRSHYKSKPIESLERLFEMCYDLIDGFLGHLLLLPTGEVIFDCGSKEVLGGVDTIWEISELILLHPLAAQISTHSLLVKGDRLDNVKDFLDSSKLSVHVMDRQILHLIRRVGDLLLTLENQHNLTVPERLIKAFRDIIKQSVAYFKQSFKLCNLRKDIISIFPSFYVFNVLMHFQPLMELLEVGHWMLHQIDEKLSGWNSPDVSALPIALYVSGSAFGALCRMLKQNKLNKMHSLLWEERSYENSLPHNLYIMVLDFALRFSLESADLCLLKAVTAAYIQKTTQTTVALLPFGISMARMVSSSPSKIIEHCIYNMSKTKSRILFRLIAISTLHLDLFGMTFFGMIGKDHSAIETAVPWLSEMVWENSNHVLSNENFLWMVPAALSLFTYNLHKFGRDSSGIFRAIPLFYSKLLLDGFSKWTQFVSGDVFYEDCDEPMHGTQELQDIFSSTLLGKSLLMLHHYFISSQHSIKKSQRLKIFESIYSSASLEDQLLDFDIMNVKRQSYVELFNQINRVVGKISFTFLLLFPRDDLLQASLQDTDKELETIHVTKKSEGGRHAKLKFMNILICTLDKIVRNLPMEQSHCGNEGIICWSQLLRFLEISILGSILRLSANIKSYLLKLRSLTFLETFVRSTLLYRFEDPSTLRALHSTLDLLQGGYPPGKVLELLLGHSKFASVVLKHVPSSALSSAVHTGVFLQPVPSVFRAVDLSFPVHSHLGGKGMDAVYFKAACFDSHCDKLRTELIRLVRLLYNLTTKQQDSHPEVVHMDKRELLSLLLSGYGASVSETDREIFNFIQEIDSAVGSDSAGIADMDYHWGASALKLRREHASDEAVEYENLSDPEAVQERSRRFFRENILIDAKLCALTVLNLCYGYSNHVASTCLKEFPQCVDMDLDVKLPGQPNTGRMPYDPVFILRFSIHSLLKGYIEPVEFARLGLLAISLVSLSSHADYLRKLGYEFLGCFQKSLADHRKNKDALQLQLLLTCLQNGITEPWQRIPSMATMFAAEASFILLDASQDHFHSISKLLMKSSKLDFKDIPLFHTFFYSSSNYFKTERLWILKLIHAGLHFNDDAHILVTKSVVELLLGFYASSLSDSETRFLILQIVKKAIKFHALACHLVEYCGLISWLYSVLLDCGSRACGDQKDFSLKWLWMVLEVIHDVINLRFVMEFLQQHALEMLSSISSYLHVMIVHHLRSLKASIRIVDTAIEIITTNLRISQKRKVYQPHFTLSLDSMFQLCWAIHKNLCTGEHSHTLYLALNMLLMSCPPPAILHADKVTLLNIILWAVSSASQPCNGLVSFLMEPCAHLRRSSEGRERKEIISRLLRWTTASLILGCIAYSRSKAVASFHGMRNKNLYSLLKVLEIEENMQTWNEFDFDINKALAVTIMYLQQLLGTDSDLSSVISALCLQFKDAYNPSVEAMLGGDWGLSVKLLCSRIRFPAEANPSWRWSFYQPWKDLSYEPTLEQQIEEEQACRTLLVTFSNALGCKSSSSSVLSHEDFEFLFTWEKRIFLGSG